MQIPNLLFCCVDPLESYMDTQRQYKPQLRNRLFYDPCTILKAHVINAKLQSSPTIAISQQKQKLQKDGILSGQCMKDEDGMTTDRYTRQC